MTPEQSKDYHTFAVELWNKAQATLKQESRREWGHASLREKLVFQRLAKRELGID